MEKVAKLKELSSPVPFKIPFEDIKILLYADKNAALNITAAKDMCGRTGYPLHLCHVPGSKKEHFLQPASLDIQGHILNRFVKKIFLADVIVKEKFFEVKKGKSHHESHEDHEM